MRQAISVSRWLTTLLLPLLLPSECIFAGSQQSAAVSEPPAYTPVMCACGAQGAFSWAGHSNSSCLLSKCTMDIDGGAVKLSLWNIRGWLPETILPSSMQTISVLLTDVNITVPNCELMWALHVQACSFQVSASWPIAGLQTGRGFTYIPYLTTTSPGAAPVTAQRLNLTCPLDRWAALEAASPLLPCGTATVTNGSQLIAALTDLQPRYLRLLVTLAANISLPTSPSPQIGRFSPFTPAPSSPSVSDSSGSLAASSSPSPPPSPSPSSATDGADTSSSSSPASDGTGSEPVSATANGTQGKAAGDTAAAAAVDADDDDGHPLVVLYRNVTLVGLSGAGPPGSSLQTELDLRARRNAFRVVQPDASANSSSSGGSSGGGGSSSSSSSSGGDGRVVLVFSDMTLVNVPPGPAATWPIGLLASDMWHIGGVNRSKNSPVQLIHLRLVLVLNAGQTRYFNYWYTRVLSLVQEERESAAWMLDVITPSVQYIADDGSATLRGLTRSYLEKYNVTATAVPLLTPPLPVAVDVWSIEDPPAPPSTVGFAASAEDLLADLSRAWTGPRVIVLLANISLDEKLWPKDGLQLASSATLAGPVATTSAAAAAAASQAQQQAQLLLPPPRPTFNMRGLPFLRVPPGSRVSFRNLVVTNMSVSISWALPDAPDSLPKVPGYSAWRTSCLPGFLDNANGRAEMNGCESPVPPDVFSLLRLYNSPLCATNTTAGAAAAGAPNTTVACISGINAVLAGMDMFAPTELATFFDRVFRASGQVAVAQPDANSLYFRTHTLTGVLLNTTTFTRVPYSGDHISDLPALGSPASCSLQTLFAMLLSAHHGSPGAASSDPTSSNTPSRQSGPASSPSSSGGKKPSAAVIGGAVGGAVAIVILAVASVVLILRRMSAGAAGSRKSGEQEDGLAGKGEGRNEGGGGGGGGGAPVPPHDSRVLGGGGGGRTAGTAATEGERVGSVAATAGVAETGLLMAAGGVPPGSDADCCSAFSQSFAVVDPMYGRVPTMLEQLMAGSKVATAAASAGPRAAREQPQQGQGQGHAGTAAGGGVMEGEAAAAGGKGGVCGRRTSLNQGTAGGGTPTGNGLNGLAGGNVLSTGGGAPTAASGSTGEGAHQALAGEIDGMIRRYEACSTGPASNQSTVGSQRQRVLGSGGFGVVYKGEWRGLPVAIKVVLLQEGDSAARRERLVREVALSATLSHPNVVSTYHYTVQPVAATTSMGGGFLAAFGGIPPRLSARCPVEVQPRGGGPPPPHGDDGGGHDDEIRAYKLSIVMAYCDRGTLKEALKEGIFKRPWLPTAAAGAGGSFGFGLGGGSAAVLMSGPLGLPPSATPPGSGGATDGGGGGGTGATPASPAVRTLGQQPPSPSGGGGGYLRGGFAPMHGNGNAQGPGVAAAAAPRTLGRGIRVPGAGFVPMADAAAAVATAATAAAVGGEAGGSPRCLRSPAVPAAPPGESRLTWSDVRPAANQALALFAALDVARGLEYLHACNVVHGDISLQNILLSSSEPVFSDALLASVSACASTINSMGVAGSQSGRHFVAGPGAAASRGVHRLPLRDPLEGSAGRLTLPPLAVAAAAAAAASAATAALAEPPPPPLETLAADAGSSDAVVIEVLPPTDQAKPAMAVPASMRPRDSGSGCGADGGVLCTAIDLTRARGSSTARDLVKLSHSREDGGEGEGECGAVVPVKGSVGGRFEDLVGHCGEGQPSAGSSKDSAAAAAGDGEGAVQSQVLAPPTPDGGTEESAVRACESVSLGGPAAAAAAAAAVVAGVPATGPLSALSDASTMYSAYGAAVAVVRSPGPDASVEEDTAAEPLAPTVSTGTPSETLWPMSFSLDNTPPVSAVGGDRRPLSIARRLSAVHQLMSQVFKISDFGLSVRLEGDETHRSGLHQGTPYYTATEVLMSGKISPAADVYSYGVCLWCLVHGVTLCQLRHLLPPIFTPVAPVLLAHMAPDLPPAIRSLLRRCLSGDPARRPTAATLVGEVQVLLQHAAGPDLAPLLLGAERREREVARTVAGLGLLDSTASAQGANG